VNDPAGTLSAIVIVACGSEKDRLRIRPQGLGGAREQDVTDDFGARRAARLAGQHDAYAERAQALRKQRRVSGLSGALPAFESDESTAHFQRL